MALITRIGSLSPVGHLRAVSAAGGRVVINLTISANTKNYNIWNNKGGTYVAGLSDITLTINSGIIIGSASTATYALDTGTGWSAGGPTLKRVDYQSEAMAAGIQQHEESAAFLVSRVELATRVQQAVEVAVVERVVEREVCPVAATALPFNAIAIQSLGSRATLVSMVGFLKVCE